MNRLSAGYQQNRLQFRHELQNGTYRMQLHTAVVAIAYTAELCSFGWPAGLAGSMAGQGEFVHRLVCCALPLPLPPSWRLVLSLFGVRTL